MKEVPNVAPFKIPIRVEDEKFLVAADGELIMEFYSSTPKEIQHIVKCVNVHAELVNSQTSMVEWIEQNEPTQADLEYARNALAKAETT